MLALDLLVGSARLAASRSSTAAWVALVISGMSQALRQASGLLFASSPLSTFDREGLGVGVRVLIVRPPPADIDVVLAGPVLGQGLLVVGRDDLDLDAGLSQVAWIAWAKSLVGELLRVPIVTLKPSGRPALASSSLPLARSNL